MHHSSRPPPGPHDDHRPGSAGRYVAQCQHTVSPVGGKAAYDPPRHYVLRNHASAGRVRPGTQRLLLHRVDLPLTILPVDRRGTVRTAACRSIATAIPRHRLRGRPASSLRQADGTAAQSRLGALEALADCLSVMPTVQTCFDSETFSASLGRRLPSPGGDGVLDCRAERNDEPCVRPLSSDADRRWLVRDRSLSLSRRYPGLCRAPSTFNAQEQGRRSTVRPTSGPTTT